MKNKKKKEKLEASPKKHRANFLVFLKVIDVKTGEAIIKLDKAIIKDLEDTLDNIVKKFK